MCPGLPTIWKGYNMDEQKRNKVSVISEDILNDKNLAPAEKMVYARICYFEEFFESAEATAEYLGVKVWTVQSAKRKLEKLGYIVCIRNTGRGKRYVADVNLGIYNKGRVCSEQSQSLVETKSDIGENKVRPWKNQDIGKKVDKKVSEKEKEIVSNETMGIPQNSKNQLKEKGNEKELWEQEFDELWQLYPRKESKADGLKFYLKARKKGVTKEQILAGIQLYKQKIEREHTERQFIIKGGNWFKGERWDDEIEIEKATKTATHLDFS